MSSFQQNITRHTKKHESKAYSKEQNIGNIPEEAQLSHICNKDFKATILKILN